MRLATIRTPEGTRAAHVVDDQVFPLAYPDVRAVLETGNNWRKVAEQHNAPPIPWEKTSFAPIVPEPRKIMAVGLNYVRHVVETNSKKPEYPPLFGLYARCLIGAYDPLAMPKISQRVDSEIELGIVIGRNVRKAGIEEAREAIAGYTIFNDISVRDWQRRTTLPMQGKAFEHLKPVGPVVVTLDELPDIHNLRIQGIIDDFVMQDARTDDMIFQPDFIVSYISTFLTLEPGDLISTGSPEGVGVARQPQKFLQLGETVTSRIEGIGEMANPCIDEDAWLPATSASPLRAAVG